MRRLIAYLILVFVSLSVASVQAQISFEKLTDRADNTVEVQINGSRGSAVFKGIIRPGDKLQGRSGSLNADIVRYADHPFFSVAVTEDGNQVGYVFILERQNSNYILVNEKSITGKASSLSVDLEDALKGLRKVKGNDTSLVMRALVHHFNQNPKTDLYSFADGLENGQQRLIEQVNRVPVPGQGGAADSRRAGDSKRPGEPLQLVPPAARGNQQVRRPLPPPVNSGRFGPLTETDAFEERERRQIENARRRREAEEYWRRQWQDDPYYSSRPIPPRVNGPGYPARNW